MTTVLPKHPLFKNVTRMVSKKNENSFASRILKKVIVIKWMLECWGIVVKNVSDRMIRKCFYWANEGSFPHSCNIIWAYWWPKQALLENTFMGQLPQSIALTHFFSSVFYAQKFTASHAKEVSVCCVVKKGMLGN